MTTPSPAASLPGSLLERAAPQRMRDNPSWKALARLLSYVSPHRKYALLTALFGTLGFLLSFAYPWIIGSVVDLISSRAGGAAAQTARLRWLTELSVVTGVLHA